MIGVVVVFSVCVSSFCDFFCGLFRWVGLGQFLCFFVVNWAWWWGAWDIFLLKKRRERTRGASPADLIKGRV